MGRSYLRVNDRKWRELKRQIPQIAGSEVTAGVQADAGASQDGTPIAAYAAYNEFGTAGGASGGGWGGPVPARAFLSGAFDDNRDKWGRAADVAISQALAGERPFAAGLGVLGTLAQQDIQAKIGSGDFAPNSPLTVALKGSSTPLIDTGALRQSIRYEVKI
jgi:hypothetical protein